MEKFSFFNSVNGDRRYKAEDWANYFNKFITNGYFPNIASNLQVIASGTNMKVTLRAGAAWINGYMYNNTTDLELTIQTADAVNSRIDRVTLRCDHEKRDIRAYVKKGTPSSSPVAPALQRDADAYELAVAEVHVRNGVVVIAQEAVTDVRLNKDLCGVVNSLLQADTTMIFNQYWDWFVRTKQKYDEDNTTIMSDFRKFMEDEKKRYNTEFTTWFQNLKNILDTNTAGNLLNEINKINDKWNATLTELDKKSQAVQHGLNVVNAPVASPINIEIQGRTLVNLLGQTALDPAKYYLYVPGKGTTKITAGSSTYEGIAKFTGQSTVSYTIKQDFRRKVAGSAVENGHIARRAAINNLNVPNNNLLVEFNVGDITGVSTLDNSVTNSGGNASTSGNIGQQMFSFDLIRTLQDKYGPQIWQGKITLAEKVSIAKQLITKLTCNWWGFGIGPVGNKATLARWSNNLSQWITAGVNTGTGVGKITASPNYSGQDLIDSNGFSYILAYAEPSNGTVASVINTDYVELELEVNTNLPLLEDALYEVDQATYNKINVEPEYSGQNLLDRFPYVQGVQHLNPVVSAEGGNLIPPLSNATTSVSGLGSFEAESSYRGTVKATTNFADFNLNLNTPCVGGQTYTFSCLDLKGWFSIRTIDESGKELSRQDIKTGTTTLKFTVPENAKMFVYWFGNNAYGAGTFYVEQPMLVLGDKPKPFAPRNPSYLYTNAALAGQNGVNDVLYQEDGQWKVLRKWERDVGLDSAKYLTGFYGNYSGYKRFGINPQALINSDYMNLNDQRFYATKYDGKILNNNSGYTSSDQAALQQPSGGGLKLTVANIDSGFTDSYTPSTDEISAYFNGWKVKTSDANGKPTAWVSVVDGKDAPTQTLAYVRANKAPNYTPYKLTYQLAIPRVETVQVEGNLVTSGITQVSVDSGIVVREKVAPAVNNTYNVYIINNITMSATSILKGKVGKILAVYKNGIIENKWVIRQSQYAYGKEYCEIPSKDFDPTAEYTVTYLVQDKHLFTTNVIDAKVTYNQSLASTVREAVEKQADTSTLLFAVQDTVCQLTAKTREYGLRLTPRRSGKDENDIFTVTEYKMANGTVRKRSVLSNPNAYGNYVLRTETEYFENGTIQKVTLLDLIYDVDGNFIDEVERT
ncbi:hypothetical protein IEO_05516 [Bacillus wiedmannii]|uniref:hypothetical protein n=1 Tax=Bacillus wiedmannii TaxID=1890302 RepID=UPI00027C1769|nr:hypothetical protein [Bacillus wiedmannii]EJV56015.1 hypothetical protein IEO_05516 [Bacillus wiedmannii]